MSPAAEPPSPAAEPLSPAGRAVAVGRAFRQAGRFDRAKVSLRAGADRCDPGRGDAGARDRARLAFSRGHDGCRRDAGGCRLARRRRPADPSDRDDGRLRPPRSARPRWPARSAAAGPGCTCCVLVIFCLIAGSRHLTRPARHRGREPVADRLHRLRSLPARTSPQALAADRACDRRAAPRRRCSRRWSRYRSPGAASGRAWPPPTAALADFTAGEPGAASIPAATALDAADQSVDAPALFADRERSALAGLVARAGASGWS